MMLQLLQQRLAPCFWNMDAGTDGPNIAWQFKSKPFCRKAPARRRWKPCASMLRTAEEWEPCDLVSSCATSCWKPLREMMSEPDRAKAHVGSLRV